VDGSSVALSCIIACIEVNTIVTSTMVDNTPQDEIMLFEITFLDVKLNFLATEMVIQPENNAKTETKV